MDWRAAVGGKLTTPEEAVGSVESGDRVGVAPFTCTPFTLCDALYARGGELENVRIDHAAGLFAWLRAGEENGFSVRDNYATPLNRDMVHAGKVDYLPIGRWRADEIAPGFDQPLDVFMVPLSPPDGHGYCSFGPGVWLSKRLTQRAKQVLAEVHENFIRTGGDNFIHVSEIDPSVRRASRPETCRSRRARTRRRSSSKSRALSSPPNSFATATQSRWAWGLYPRRWGSIWARNRTWACKRSSLPAASPSSCVTAS